MFLVDFEFQDNLLTSFISCRKWKPPLLTAMERRQDISLSLPLVVEMVSQSRYTFSLCLCALKSFNSCTFLPACYYSCVQMSLQNSCYGLEFGLVAFVLEVEALKNEKNLQGFGIMPVQSVLTRICLQWLAYDWLSSPTCLFFMSHDYQVSY